MLNGYGGVGVVLMTGITFLFGVFDPVLQLVIYLMLFDFLTGVLNAVVTYSYSHRKALIGTLTKVVYLLLIGVGTRIDAVGFYTEPVFRTAITWGVILIELGSVIDNLDSLGIPVPKVLINFINLIRSKKDGY